MTRKRYPTFKRMLAMFLSVLMLLMQLPTGVFAVDVAEEETVTPAGVLPLGSSVTVESETLFAFTPEQSGVYRFFSVSEDGTDPKMRLLDENKQQLAQDDDGGEGLNFELHYELTAGTTYYVEAGAYSNKFPYKLAVEESNLLSIEIVSVPTFEVVEYDMSYGGFATVYQEEIVDRYFIYYPEPALRQAVIRVNYKDGTSEEVAFRNEDNEYSGMSMDWDFYRNPWKVGSDNHYYITYKGMKALANATVIASTVTHMELVSTDFPEFVEHDESQGYWSDYYESIELDEPYFTYGTEKLYQSIKLSVTYADGSTEQVSYLNDQGEYTGAGIRIYSNQYVQPWSVGENEFEIWYKGACVTATATVAKSDVQSIRVISDNHFEYTEFDTAYGHWAGEEYFYYTPERFMQDVVLEVTYTDGSTAEIVAAKDDAVAYRDTQHEKPWTVGEDNELRISYKGVSTTAYVTVKPGIVESISVEDVVITEGTHGSLWVATTPGGIEHWYHYDIFAEHITVHLTDGTTLCGDQEYIWEQLGASVTFDTETYQNYEQKWGVGEYTVTANLMGKKTEFLFIIEESNIASISAEDVQIEQNQVGYWDTDYLTEDGERVQVEWFRYQPHQNVQMTVTFKDGTQITGTMGVLAKEYDLYPEGVTDQSVDNQWQPGGTYTAKVYLGGKLAEFSVSITESNIKSIEVIDTQDFVYFENDTACGEWRGDFFWYSAWELASRITIRVTYKDDTTQDISYYDEYGVYTGITYTERQHETPWTVGGENLITISYGGAKTTISATIQQSPVTSIVVAPITYTQYTNGHWNEGGYWDETGNWVSTGRYFHYHVYPQNITITYTDGRVITGSPEEIANQTGTYPEYFVPQSGESPWGIGDHTATLTFMGKTVEFTVSIEESNIASITAPDLTYMEGTGGGWNDYYENGMIVGQYYHYNCEPNVITVTYKDGSSITGTFEEFAQQTGYRPEIITEQSYDNPWGVGNHTATVFFMGATYEFNVEITASPVASIVVDTITHVQHTNGSWYDGGYYDEYGNWIEAEPYYAYSVYPQNITITYTDGSVVSGNPEEIANQTGFYPEFGSCQSSQNLWGIGDHTANLSFMGKTVEYTVSIVESNVASITASDLTYTEGTGGYWQEYSVDGVVAGHYYYYNCQPEMFTVTYKDGSFITGTYEEIGQQTGCYPEITMNQGYNNHWGVGTHTATVSYMGATDDFEIVITPSSVASIAVETLTYLEHTNGEWRNHWNEEGEQQYYHYYINLNQITITYTDGTVISGSPYEIERQTGYWVNTFAVQSYDNQWGIGSHTATAAFMGKTVEFTVDVVASPVASIVVDSVTIEEGTNGYWHSDNNGGYYLWYDVRPQNITVTYTDETVWTGSYDELYQLVDGQISYGSEQSDSNRWASGTYTATLYFMGKTAEYNVTIEECQIDSITVLPRILVAGRDGWLSNEYFDPNLGQWVQGEWYQYNTEPEMILVKFKDGTTYKGDYEGLHRYGYVLRLNHDQSYDNPWQVGAHTVTLQGACFSTSYQVEIVEKITSETAEYSYGVLADGTAVLLGYSGSIDAVIPETIDGYAVTVLGRNLFQYYTFTSLTVPSTVRRIDGYAFYYCDSLQTVRLYNGIEVIAPYVFDACSNLTTVVFFGTEEEANRIDIFRGNDFLTAAQWKYAGDCTEHEYDDVCDAECNICYAVHEPEHAFEWVIGYAGNCVEDGWKYERCTLCEATRNHDTVIPAKGEHTNTELRNVEEPTCDGWGYTGDLYCYDCQQYIQSGESIDPTGHRNTEVLGSEPATCGKWGYSGDTYCHDCNSYIENGEPIEPTGQHEHTDIVNAAEATCGSAGYTGDLYCYDCGNILALGENIPVKDHENTAILNAREATCGQTGYTGDLYCNDCGNIVEYGEEIPATGNHGALTMINVTAATCDKPGYTGDVFCEDCQTVVQYGEDIPATNEHVYDNGYDADCNECGAVREVTLKPATLSLVGGTAYQGETIRVDIRIDGNTGFAGLQLGVLYDNTYLTLQSVETQMEDFVITVHNSIVFDSFKNHTADGVIATLVFEVAQDAPVGDYNVQLRFMSGSTEDFEAVVMTGSATTIKVESAVAGDANGDGKVDTTDLVMIRKYLAYMDPVTMTSDIVVKKGADTNDDGVIDARDLAFVRQYLASMPVS